MVILKLSLIIYFCVSIRLITLELQIWALHVQERGSGLSHCFTRLWSQNVLSDDFPRDEGESTAFNNLIFLVILTAI